MDEWQDLLRSVQAYFFVGGLGIALAIAIRLATRRGGQPLLPLPRLRRGRWAGNDVVVALSASYLTQLAAVLLLSGIVTVYRVVTSDIPIEQAANGLQRSRLLVLGSPVWVLGTVTIVCGCLYFSSRTRPQQLGLTLPRWSANAVVGVLAFVAMTPLTLAVYFVAIHVLGTERNPLELLIEQGFAPWEWALLVFMTVVGAPLTEELVFRGVLQGWLARARPIGHAVLMATVLAIGAKPVAAFLLPGVLGTPDPDPVKTFAPAAFSAALVGGYGLWLWTIGMRRQRDHLVEGPTAWDWANARLAIYGSAMLFAVIHGWPQSLPLFLFALTVGWLAYRTQSLIGCMVCHALFNAVACLVLYWGTTA